MQPLAHRLLNDFQRDFPLTPDPFARIARSLHTDPGTVLATLRDLQQRGAVSRVGPVFRPNTVGASTLAAIAAPPHDLERVAGLVGAFPAVNHNYEREHRLNLWFVVTAADRPALARTLRAIRETTGYPVLSLPLIRAYHIDLAFDLESGERRASPARGCRAATRGAAERAPAASAELIEAVQDGLPLVGRPYRNLGARLGRDERSVIRELASLIEAGIIERLGVVVRHHELGFRANAMIVWDVPAGRVDELGRRFGDEPRVTLCYQRPRRLPDWPYNLFCMVHGRDRGEVLATLEDMAVRLGLGGLRHDVLFSTRRFKQRGARYRFRH